MLNPFVSCFIYTIEAMIYNSFFMRISEPKFSEFKCLLIGLGLFQIGSILNLLCSNSIIINTISITLIIIFHACACYNMQIKTAVFYGVILNVIEFALELVAVLSITAILHINISNYQDNIHSLMLETLVCKAALFLICLLLANLVCDSTAQKIPVSLFAYPCSVTICLLVLWYICLSDQISQISRVFLTITSAVLLFSAIFLFQTFQREVEKDTALNKIRQENAHLRTEKEYYDILERQNQDLMIYAHDARKHLTAIRELSDNSLIDDYVVKLFGQLKSYTQLSHSGNKMLDVMISRYILDSSLRGISFYYDVKECSLCGVEELDLVAILGNLMDNAIAAAVNSTEKRIELITTIRNTYSVIILKNSCDVPPNARGEKLLSTKENPRFHGYGLESVKRTLHKYMGDLYWTYNSENHVFSMTVTLQEYR